MRILWLATDRIDRVANIFGPLQEEVSKISDVSFIYRKLNHKPKLWQSIYTKGKKKPSRLVNPKFANEFDFIMVDAPFAFLDENWDNIKTKRGVLIEDQHGDVLSYTRRYINNGFDVFFTRYNNILKQHPWLKDQNIKWLPHSFDPEIFKDYKIKKKHDCLMVGRIEDAWGSKKVYPVRWKTHKQLSNSNVSYYRVERPNEYTSKHLRWPIQKDYAKLISCSKISFTCMSIFKYPVMKYFEIPACNSALFADYNDELKDLGFEPNECMVSLNGVDNIPELVKSWLGSPKELSNLSGNGYELVHEKHTAKKRAKELIDYIEEL